MTMRLSNRLLLLTLAGAALLAAQDDPPGRVGRLNYMNGAVSFEPGGVDEWVAASLNRPLTTGDRLWVDDSSRAEMHIGSAALRLGSKTAFEFLNLDDRNVQIRLTEGSLNVRVRRLDEGDIFEVDTPNLAFSLLRPGEYRIDVDPDRETSVVLTRSGDGEVTGGGQAFAVHPRQQAQVSGTDSLTYDVNDAAPPDQWDNWCADRDRREDRSESARYVSRDMIGYEDLDQYGSWQDTPDYGQVWAPRAVAVGWAPYHNGHWAWIEPWGWTWVDDAPWGFAPFHYGRWAFYRSSWIWVPGPVAVRPVYAPALVAWVGGPRFSLGISAGGGVGVGWVPLGPREIYRPSYHVSNTYITRVNNTTINNINVTNVRYVNQTAPGGITAVSQNAFASGRRVSESAVRVEAQQVRTAQVLDTAPVAPRRESVLGRPGAARGEVARPPANVMNRPVVAKAAPPPAPVPFTTRQEALAANPGRPLDPATVQNLRAREPVQARPMVRQAAAPAVQPNRPGMRDFEQRRPGTPVNQAPQAVPQTAAPQNRPFVRDRNPQQQEQPRPQNPAWQSARPPVDQQARPQQTLPPRPPREDQIRPQAPIQRAEPPGRPADQQVRPQRGEQVRPPAPVQRAEPAARAAERPPEVRREERRAAPAEKKVEEKKSESKKDEERRKP